MFNYIKLNQTFHNFFYTSSKIAFEHPWNRFIEIKNVKMSYLPLKSTWMNNSFWEYSKKKKKKCCCCCKMLQLPYLEYD